MDYLTLAKKIMQDELTNDDLIECLSVPNVTIIQQTILKIIERGICDSRVHNKLLEYSKCMDVRFKILGLCKIGHLAIYALKKLEYTEDFQSSYEKLSDEDKEQVVMLDKAFS